jgi:putative endonuclease
VTEVGPEKVYCVYILTNDRNTVLYTGITSNLKGRIYQHRKILFPGFAKRYNVWKLVYYETGTNASGAITREKQIKPGSRKKKLDLINDFNPEGRDLYDDV